MSTNNESVNVNKTKKTSQGATRHCCYGPCNSDSRYKDREHMQGVWWIPFPKPTKEIEKCRRWVQACGRENFTVEKVSRWTYICNKHFVGGDGPTPENPDPIPAQVSHIPQKRKLEASDVNVDSKKLILDASEGLMLLKESLTQSLHQVLQKRSMLQELQHESTIQPINQDLVSPLESTNQASSVHSLKQEPAIQPLQQQSTIQSLKHMSPEQSVNQVSQSGTVNQASSTQSLNQVSSVQSVKEMSSIQSLNQVSSALSLNQVSSAQPLDHQVSTAQSLNKVSPAFSVTQVSPAPSLKQVSPANSLYQVSHIISLKEEPLQEELNQKSSMGSLKHTSHVQSLKQESTVQSLPQESPTQSFNHVSQIGSVNQVSSNGSLNQISSVKLVKDKPPTQSLKHVSQIVPANHVSKVGSANKVSQIVPANHVSHTVPANHVSQVGSTNQVSQIEPANHVSQVGSTNQVSQIEPADHVSKIVSGNNVSKVGSANHVSQIVPANYVSQIVPENGVPLIVPANNVSNVGSANHVSQIGSENKESPKGSLHFMSPNQMLFLHAWNQASRVQSQNEVSPIGCLDQESPVQSLNHQIQVESSKHSTEHQINQELLRPSSRQPLPIDSMKQSMEKPFNSPTIDLRQMSVGLPDIGHIHTISKLVGEKTDLLSQLTQSRKIAQQRFGEVEDLKSRLKTSQQRVAELERSLILANISVQKLEQKPTVKELQAYQERLHKEAAVQTISPEVYSQEVQTSFLCSSILANKIHQTVSKNEEQKVQIKEDIDRLKQVNCFQYEKISKKAALFEFYTGLTVKQFDHLFSCVGPRVGKMPDIDGNWTDSKPEKKLCLKDQMFLMMMKLRHGFPNRDLAYKFEVSANTVSCILNRWIQILHYQIMCLKKKMFPSRELIRENMPVYLQSFRKLRIVLNCLVILTEQPIDLVEDGNMFSCDRYPDTIKVVIGITPSGAISFISDAYEGNVVEKDIILNSGLLDLLEVGDLVVAERDFLIGEELQTKRCDLIKPPFVAKWEKLTPQKEIQIKNINRVRAHSESIIDRMKRFKIIGGILPHGLKPAISQIVHIVGFLVNYQQPFDE